MDTSVLDLLSSSSSSSSSSDDDDVIAIEFLLNNFGRKPKVLHFVEEVVDKYSEKDFRAKFRVNRQTADRFEQMYQASAYFKRKADSGGIKEIPAKTQVLAFLWFAGNKTSYREVGNLFNISVSTMFKVLTNILEFIFEVSPNFIKMPSTNKEKFQAADDFEQIAGFPGVIGCIDGSYLFLTKPANKKRSTYINRHDSLSLTLQGICDAEKRFIDVFVGCPNKIHDSRVYELSFISNDLPSICGTEYHILGDAAYPLREYMMTPFRNTRSITNQQRRYNKKHSQTRVKIENSFSDIKTRFRQLMRLDFHSVERMSKFILACCVLHNICIDQGDLWDEDDEEENVKLAHETTLTTQETQEFVDRSQRDRELQELGSLKRNKIAN